MSKSDEHQMRILQKMAEFPERLWGSYELSRAIGMRSGLLYPLLTKLLKGEFIIDSWRPREEPIVEQRTYRLTDKGNRAAKQGFLGS